MTLIVIVTDFGYWLYDTGKSYLLEVKVTFLIVLIKVFSQL